MVAGRWSLHELSIRNIVRKQYHTARSIFCTIRGFLYSDAGFTAGWPPVIQSGRPGCSIESQHTLSEWFWRRTALNPECRAVR